MAKRYLGLCVRCWKHPQFGEALICETCFSIVTQGPPPLPTKATRSRSAPMPLCRYCGMVGMHAQSCRSLRLPPPLPKRVDVPVTKPPIMAEPEPTHNIPQPPVIQPPKADDDWLAKLEAQSFPQRNTARAMKKYIVHGAIGATLISLIYISAVVIPRHIPDSPRHAGRQKPLPELKLEEMTPTHAVDLTQR